MASKASNKSPKRVAFLPDDVDAFLRSIDHPLMQEILSLRQIILDADPGIVEGIKWNAPSFRTTEYFATFHLRAKDGVQVIMHFGAKKRDKSATATKIDDPESLLGWLSNDRASVKFRDLNEIQARRSAFTNVIRQWIKHV